MRMQKILSMAAIFVGVSASPIFAQCSIIENDAERLECYDAAVKNLPEPCEIEDFAFDSYGSGLKLTGAMTCSAGRINYRLYDGDDNFLVAGFAYFDGYSLVTMEDVPAPEMLNIKYSVERD